MGIRDFPTIRPFDTIELDAQVEPHIYELLVQTDQESKAAIAASLDPSVSVPSALSLLEASADWLELAARTMRRRMFILLAMENEKANMNAPIARLPTELLSEIFQYDADDIDHQLGRNAELRRSWLRRGMVCCWWRRVPFRTPTVWANEVLSFGYEKGLHLLPLTQGALLELNLYDRSLPPDFWTAPSDTPWSPSVLQRARRIFYRPSSAESASQFFESVCSRSLPDLQKLEVYSNSSYTRNRVSDIIMAEHMSLRVLILAGVFVRPHPTNRLRSLTIFLIEVQGHEHRLKMDVLLDVLSQCTSLEMSSLTITESAKCSIALLDHLAIPELKEVRVSGGVDTLCAIDSTMRAWTWNLPQRSGKSSTHDTSVNTIRATLRISQRLQDQRVAADDLLQRLKDTCMRISMGEIPSGSYCTIVFRIQV